MSGIQRSPHAFASVEHCTWDAAHGGLTIFHPSGQTCFLQGDDASGLQDELESVGDEWDNEDDHGVFTCPEEVTDCMCQEYFDAGCAD